MTWWQALVLGLVQGLTEFLPISSSAHLVLVPHALGWRLDPARAFVFDVWVQLGTLLAVLVYFRHDWAAMMRAAWRVARAPGSIRRDPEARLLGAVALATVPAALAGLVFKDAVEAAFAAPRAVGGFLLFTAAWMAWGEMRGRRRRDLTDLTWWDALLVGLGQALALLPGVSRSGATIAAGMLRDLKRPAAARFSFLMAVPIMLGAGLVALKDWAALPPDPGFALAVAVGFAAAALAGYAAIRALLGFLARHSLWPFVVYCALLGAWVWTHA